jgi:hypothetical protein
MYRSPTSTIHSRKVALDELKPTFADFVIPCYDVAVMTGDGKVLSPSGGFGFEGRSQEVRLRQVKNGVSNPNYKRLIKDRVNASSAYESHLVQSCTMSPGTIHFGPHPFYPYNSVETEVHSCAWAQWGSLIQPSTAMPTDTLTSNSALSKAIARLNEQETRLDGMPFLKETVPELRNSVQSLAHASDTAMFQTLKKVDHELNRLGYAGRKVRAVAHLAKVAADAWLTYSFSLMPGISDIETLSQVVARQMADVNPPPVRCQTRAETLITYNAKRINLGTTGYASGGQLLMYGDGQRVQELSCQYTLAEQFIPSSGVNYSTAAQLTRNLGLDLRSFVPTLWELTPFSWFGDYFFNMNDVLDDVFLSRPNKFIYGCVTWYMRELTHLRSTGEILSPVPYQFLTPFDVRCESVHMKRTPLSSVPLRSLYYRPSEIISKNWVAKALNSSSALYQQVYKRVVSKHPNIRMSPGL